MTCKAFHGLISMGEGNPCKNINLGPGGAWEETPTNFSHPHSFPCVHGLQVISFLSEYGKLSSVFGDSSVLPSSPRCAVLGISGIAVPASFHAQGMLHFVAVGWRRENWGSCSLCPPLQRPKGAPAASKPAAHSVCFGQGHAAVWSVIQPLGGTPWAGLCSLGWQR